LNKAAIQALKHTFKLNQSDIDLRRLMMMLHTAIATHTEDKKRCPANDERPSQLSPNGHGSNNGS
jgi:hypothetical protein